MASPFDQSRYQVRFEWGSDGLDRLAPSDAVVVVDVLSFSTTVTDRVAAGETVELRDARSESINGAVIAERAGAAGAVVFAGCLRNASAVAVAALAEQQQRAQRTSIAVIAAGERTSPQSDGPVRFAVEDLLGAGAVIDALGALGIDHTSPEAAAACESFRGLRQALRHLLTASGSGQELVARERRDDVLHASDVDAAASAPRLRNGVFAAA